MSKHWSQQQERGNRFVLHLLKWVALGLGRRVVLMLLVPIVSYYILFAKASRRASEDFLSKSLGRKPTWKEVWKHFYTFAVVSVDRFYFLTDKTRGLNIQLSGEEVFNQFVDAKQGCILIVSHVGSFDVMRAPAVKHHQLPIRILMDKQHNARAMELLETLAPDLAEGVIDAKTFAPELSLTLNQCIQNGEFIGIMADRANAEDKVVAVDFMGEQAAFPVGPWMLSMILHVPVVLCFGMYQGNGQYQVSFELMDNLVKVPRKQRNEAIEAAVAQYAQCLEHHTRQAPYNWFNFYEFWSHETTTNH